MRRLITCRLQHVSGWSCDCLVARRRPPLDSAWAGSTDDHGATTLSDTHRRKPDAVCDETSARHADIDDPDAMLTEDTRGREQEFTLDRKGFTLIKAPT